MNLCVYCSSSDAVDRVHFEVAGAFGTRLGERNDTLVYGGAAVGLMGELARSAQAAGGNVIGILPRSIAAHGIGFETADELILAESLRERKRLMEERADGFVALPGGFGTLEELLEIITLKQLGEHKKPVVLLNNDGFYDRLFACFEQLYAAKFAKPETREMYVFCNTVEEVFEYLDGYAAPKIVKKWFSKREPG